MELTKEMVADFLKQRQVDIQVHKKSKEIVEKVSTEIKNMFTNGKYLVGFNICEDNKVSFSISINGEPLELYICNNDIFYSEASLLIELRNIKDLLYDAKKKMQKPKPKSLWRRFLDY
jgi:uncharacterized protein (DUF488 family)